MLITFSLHFIHLKLLRQLNNFQNQNPKFHFLRYLIVKINLGFSITGVAKFVFWKLLKRSHGYCLNIHQQHEIGQTGHIKNEKTLLRWGTSRFHQGSIYTWVNLDSQTRAKVLNIITKRVVNVQQRNANALQKERKSQRLDKFLLQLLNI